MATGRSRAPSVHRPALAFGAVVAAMAVAAAHPAAAADPGPALPAYSHNDYRNARPLADALALGYRGVEADVFLVDGELRVAHERGETSPGRTLAALYLEPLRALSERDGAVLADGSPFLLNIEAKEPGRATYDALRAELARFAGILAVVRDGIAVPGLVQVVLVGWHPPLAEMAAESPRYAAVQCRFRDLSADQAIRPAHLVKLVSVRYGDAFDWQGDEAPPPDFRRQLSAIAAAAGAVDGRWLRVYDVPRRSRVYEALLSGGVDLIGTKDLERSGRLLRSIRERGRPGREATQEGGTRPCP